MRQPCGNSDTEQYGQGSDETDPAAVQMQIWRSASAHSGQSPLRWIKGQASSELGHFDPIRGPWWISIGHRYRPVCGRMAAGSSRQTRYPIR